MCVLYVSVPLFPSVMAYVYATFSLFNNKLQTQNKTKTGLDTCDTQLEYLSFSLIYEYVRVRMSRACRDMVNYILLQHNKEAHMRERSVFHTCALLRPETHRTS